jgi:hypothetical protein
MAKKPKMVEVGFWAKEANRTYPGVVYSKLTLPKNKLRFLHLERKGDTFFLLDTIDPKSFGFEFIREEGSPTYIQVGDEKLEISRHTVVSLSSKEFYHLDELPDGTWRIAYTGGFFSFDHNDIRLIMVTPDCPD